MGGRALIGAPGTEGADRRGDGPGAVTPSRVTGVFARAIAMTRGRKAKPRGGTLADAPVATPEKSSRAAAAAGAAAARVRAGGMFTGGSY